MFFRLFVGIVALTWSSSAVAQWPSLSSTPKLDAVGKNDAALIIAIDDYMMLPDVPGAVDNANDWEVFFRNGLKVPEVFVVTNQDATRESMLKFAGMAARNVKKGGTLWVVFIGHGAPNRAGEGMLVGADAQQTVESLETRGLKQEELHVALKSKAAKTVMVVDACFSGRAPDGQALAVGVQPVVPMLEDLKIPSSTIVLSASKGNEVAGQLEGMARPAFSYLALGALRGWADDGDGTVTAQEVLYWSQRKLRGVKGRQQTPQGVGGLTLPLTTGVAEPEPEVGPISTEPCPEGQTRENGSCVSPSTAATQPAGHAERVLQYMTRRITFDEHDIAFIGPNELDSIAFYHEIGRPDLADEYMTHNPYMWVPGIVATAAGVALLSYGLSQDSDGWKIGGFMGGFFTMSAGISLVTFGFLFDYDPMSDAEKRSASEVYNRKLREDLQLGPEVDWDNKSRNKSGFWPFSSLTPRTPSIGVTIQF